MNNSYNFFKFAITFGPKCGNIVKLLLSNSLEKEKVYHHTKKLISSTFIYCTSELPTDCFIYSTPDFRNTKANRTQHGHMTN